MKLMFRERSLRSLPEYTPLYNLFYSLIMEIYREGIILINYFLYNVRLCVHFFYKYISLKSITLIQMIVSIFHAEIV